MWSAVGSVATKTKTNNSHECPDAQKRLEGAGTGALITKRKGMHTNQETSTKVPNERESARSSPSSSEGNPPRSQGDDADVGDLYLQLFSTPIAANTEGTYTLVRKIIRAVLEGKSIHHAQAAVEAAWDEASDQIDRWISSGGQDR
jgi:hypothetical protein